MYEAAHARPDGRSTVARLAATAADYGFEGVVVRNHGDALAGYDPAKLRERYGVDVIEGVEIRTDDPSRAGGYLGSHRPQTTVVLVHGGAEAINRFAVEQRAVDVLAHPAAGGAELDDVLARRAAENGVRLEVNLAPVLRSSGGGRARALDDLRALRDLIADADAPYVVSADPASHLELRAPRELLAVGEAVGLGREWVAEGLAEWGRLADRNRERRSGDYVAPGVRRGPYRGEEG